MKVLIVVKSLMLVIGFVLLKTGNGMVGREGVVIEKYYEPAYDKIIEYYSINMDAPMEMVRVMPEKYYIVLKSNKDEILEFQVDKSFYQVYEVGDKLTGE